MTSNSSIAYRSWKLPASFNIVAIPLVLSFLMSGIASALATWRVVGFASDLPAQWLRGWGLTWAIAFPTVLLVLPLVRRIVAAVVEPAAHAITRNEHARKYAKAESLPSRSAASGCIGDLR